MNAIITVVVPIYNTEKFLNRCVGSIVNQTYRNLEILLIDDGSPDNCPEMCDEWAKKDSRIRVIHKQNEGLGMARNTGIENATGDYICFFDSDDYIDLRTIELAAGLADDEEADVVIFGMKGVNASGEVVGCNVPRPSKCVYEGEEIREVLLPRMLGPDPKTGRGWGLSLSACRCVFNLDRIRKCGWRFVSEREIISEDIYSLIDLYKHLNRVCILKEALYYYCVNENSLTHTYRADRFEQCKHFYLKCLELCETNGYSQTVAKQCMMPFLGGVFAALKQGVYHAPTVSEAIKRIRFIVDDEVLQQVLKEKKNDFANRKKKIFYWCIRNRMYIFCYFLLMGKKSLKK